MSLEISCTSRLPVSPCLKVVQKISDSLKLINCSISSALLMPLTNDQSLTVQVSLSTITLTTEIGKNNFSVSTPDLKNTDKR